jgi:hypothetical protein
MGFRELRGYSVVEEKKIAILGDLGSAYYSSLFYIMPNTAVVTLLVLIWGGYYIGKELSGIQGQDRLKLLGLQLTSKLSPNLLDDFEDRSRIESKVFNYLKVTRSMHPQNFHLPQLQYLKFAGVENTDYRKIISLSAIRHSMPQSEADKVVGLVYVLL